MSESKPRCSEMLWRRRRRGERQCSRTGTVMRDSCWYCYQHDPVEAEKRDQARHVRAAAPDLLAALKDGLDNIDHDTTCKRSPCDCGLSVWADMARAAIAKAEGR